MDKDEVRRALDAATIWPWEVVNLGDAHIAQGYRVENGKHTAYWIADMCCDDEQDEEKIFADAHLIANAPTWLRELLAENEQLRSEIDACIPLLRAAGMTTRASRLENLLRKEVPHDSQ